MGYNVEDGYNNRSNFIAKSNDMNRLNQNGPSNFDNSFAKMRTEERRNLVTTTDSNIDTKPLEETRGTKDNFVVRNSQLDNLHRMINQNRFNRPN